MIVKVFGIILEFVGIKFFRIWLGIGIVMNCVGWNYYFYFSWDVDIIEVKIFLIRMIYLKYWWVKLERFVYDVIEVIDVLSEIVNGSCWIGCFSFLDIVF